MSYSLFFAFNAIAMLSGPFLYLWLSRYVDRRPIITACFTLMAFAGVLVFLFGSMGPVAFAAVLFPATLMASCVRTPGPFLMLEQQREHAGAASALINCSGLLFGSLGMMLATSGGEDLVPTIGALYILVGAACAISWLAILRKRSMVEVPEIARHAPPG